MLFLADAQCLEPMVAEQLSREARAFADKYYLMLLIIVIKFWISKNQFYITMVPQDGFTYNILGGIRESLQIYLN